MNHQPFVAWLISNEYSPVTIQKYTRALARFFAETGAGPAPAAALCAPRTRHPVAAHSVRHEMRTRREPAANPHPDTTAKEEPP